MDKATRDEVQRFLVVQSANTALPAKYADLILNFDKITADEVDEIVD